MKINQTTSEIYEEYRDEMARTLSAEERSPQMFENLEYVEHFALKVERLDALIALYRDLLLTNRN